MNKKVRQKIYTIVFHDVRKKLNLTFSEYAYIDTVSILSKLKKYDYWCVEKDENIAEQLGIGIATVKRAIKKGKELGLIEVEYGKKRTTDKWFELTQFDTKYQNDTIEKDEKYQNDTVKSIKMIPEKYQNDNHTIIYIDKDIDKDNIADKSAVGDVVNDAIEILKPLNPVGYTKWFANKTQRKNVELLLKEFDLERLEKLVSLIIKFSGKEFFPTITTPTQLVDKLPQVKKWIENKGYKKKKQITIL